MPHRTTKRQMRVSKTGHTNHDRQSGGNSTYKKLAVQWLIAALCRFGGPIRNRQLLVAANHYNQV